MLIRLEALELAANAGEADASDRFNLNAIQARADGSVVVTDGTQLLRIHAAVEEPSLFDTLLPDVERGYEGDVLIDAEDARDFKAACKKALKRAGAGASEEPEPVHVVVAHDDEQLTLATTNGIITRRFTIKQAAEGRYPDVDRVIPTGDMRHITISVDLLIKMLRTLKRLKCRAVRLGLTARPEAPIHIEAESLAGHIDGALMPMRDAKDEQPVESVDIETGEIHESSAQEARH